MPADVFIGGAPGYVWPAAPDHLNGLRHITSLPRKPRRAHGSRACRQGPLGWPRDAHAIG
jgi:hypothetical protein